MFEDFRSFADYIRDYELQRAEGVLLRHLNSVFKVLGANRARHRQERSGARNGTLSRHDDPAGGFQPARRMGEDARPELPARRNQGSPSARRRGSRRRHHARHQGLHRRDPQPHLHFPARTGEWRISNTAIANLDSPQDADGQPWTADRLQQALDAYHAEHERICLDPERAQRPPHLRHAVRRQENPGACSRCWWTRKSTTTGWRNSRWTWPNRASWASRF